jgi:hypothetical protein
VKPHENPKGIDQTGAAASIQPNYQFIRSMFQRCVTGGLVAFFLSACVSVPRVDLNDPQTVSKNVEVHRDEFTKQTQFIGPYLTAGRDGFVTLRALKSDSGPAVYQIYVSASYDGEWRYYDSAYDSNGTELETTVIDRKVSSCAQSYCNFVETLGIKVSRNYLKENQNLQGVRFKIMGKRGEAIFYISAQYIGGFLAAVQ